MIAKNIKKIKTRSGVKRKTDFDVEIIFGPALLLKNLDVFILFSGDSNFIYLAQQLKKRKKKVVVGSPFFRTAKELQKTVDEYLGQKRTKETQKTSANAEDPPFQQNIGVV